MGTLCRKRFSALKEGSANLETLAVIVIEKLKRVYGPIRCLLLGHRGYTFYSDGQVCSYTLSPIPTKGNRNSRGRVCYQKACIHCGKLYGPYITKRTLDSDSFDRQQDALDELLYLGQKVKGTYQKRYGVWFQLENFEYATTSVHCYKARIPKMEY